MPREAFSGPIPWVKRNYFRLPSDGSLRMGFSLPPMVVRSYSLKSLAPCLNQPTRLIPSCFSRGVAPLPNGTPILARENQMSCGSSIPSSAMWRFIPRMRPDSESLTIPRCALLRVVGRSRLMPFFLPAWAVDSSSCQCIIGRPTNSPWLFLIPTRDSPPTKRSLSRLRQNRGGTERQIFGCIPILKQDGFILQNWLLPHESLCHGKAIEILHRMITPSENFSEQRKDGLGIDGCESLKISPKYRDDAAVSGGFFQQGG